MPRDAFAAEPPIGNWEERPASPSPLVLEFPVMAEEAFTGLAGDIVRMVEPHTESDRAGLLLSAHACFGNCIGRGPHYRVEAPEHGTNLFVVKVGDSSKARKGTGEDRIISFFRHADSDWVNQRVHSGLSSGEGVIHAVRDPVTGYEKQGKGAVRVEVEIDPGIADKRLMVIESEFAGALRVMQREGNILSRIARAAWVRGKLVTLSENEPVRATGSCVSIIGHIAATALPTSFAKTAMANGFGNGFTSGGVRRRPFRP